MSLWSFIKKRRKELNMTQEQLEEKSTVSHLTFTRIEAGGTILNSTKQKLALALQCSIGDLNAAIAEPVVPAGHGHEMDMLAKENGELPVMDAVEKLDQLVRKEHPLFAEATGKKRKPKTEPAEEKEEPAKQETVTKAVMAETEAFDTEEPEKEEPDLMFPDETLEEMEERLDRETDIAEDAAESAIAIYKGRLKDICFRKMLRINPGQDDTLADLYADIGRALLEELMKEG